METRSIKMTSTKETKRMIRYDATESGEPLAFTCLYVAKWALGTPPPRQIVVTVAEGGD